jgi:two-component system NtrC family sensor kinase
MPSMKTVKNILLVEDSEPLRNVLKEKLTAEGFTILEASGGEEGLKIALAEKPDLIISDLVMYPVDGRMMIEKIRQDPWGKTAAVAALTNQNDMEEEERLKPYNLVAYWMKADSSLDEIVAKIKDLAKDGGKKKE